MFSWFRSATKQCPPHRYHAYFSIEESDVWDQVYLFLCMTCGAAEKGYADSYHRVERDGSTIEW